MALTTKNSANAMIRKLTMVFTNAPYPIVTAATPSCAGRKVRKIPPASEKPEGRHEDIVRERRDDLAERGSDDDRDRKVDHVPARREGLELVEKRLHR